MTQQRNPEAVVNLGRHKRNCSVCGHQQREEIESAFIAGVPRLQSLRIMGWQIGPASTVTLTRWDSFQSVSEMSGRRWSGSSKRLAKWT
jgi:hypothetical protein